MKYCGPVFPIIRSETANNKTQYRPSVLYDGAIDIHVPKCQTKLHKKASRNELSTDDRIDRRSWQYSETSIFCFFVLIVI